jgi:hypothetical protein
LKHLKENEVMKSRNTVSNLTMAAFTLLIAALPCVAQAQSNQNRRDSTKLLATAGSGVTLTVNSKAVAPEAAPTSAASAAKKTDAVKPLSLASFMNAGQFTKSTGTLTSDSQMRFETSASDFKPRDLSDTPSKRGGIEFLPSRGPWNMK